MQRLSLVCPHARRLWVADVDSGLPMALFATGGFAWFHRRCIPRDAETKNNDTVTDFNCYKGLPVVPNNWFSIYKKSFPTFSSSRPPPEADRHPPSLPTGLSAVALAKVEASEDSSHEQLPKR